MAFITVDGQDLIAAKQGASEVLTIASFVLANIPGLGAEPSDRIEALPPSGQIVATRPVTRSGYVNANQVVYSLAMDSALGDFDFNWVGIISAEGTLVACAHIPLIHKRANSGGVPGNNITRNFLLAYSGITATTAVAVPAETWQIDFNARLWGIDERERLSNYDVYGHDAFLGSGFAVVHTAGTSYDVQPGLAYVGGIRAALAAAHTLTATPWPTAVWLDVSLQGDISSVGAVLDYIVSADPQADYTDTLGFDHYVVKLADIAADGSVVDRRRAGGFAQALALSGLTLSNNAGNPNTQIDIAPGAAWDTAGHAMLALSAVLTKTLQAAGAWAAGGGNNGLFTGIRANSTWYHVFLIRKTADGSIDAGFDTSISAANIPAGYVAYRRLGSIRTNASGNIIAFIQAGRWFQFATPILDVSSSSTIPTSTLYTLSTPPGIKALAKLVVTLLGNSPTAYVRNPDAADIAPSGYLNVNTGIWVDGTVEGHSGELNVLTNTASQVGVRFNSDAAGTYLFGLTTQGWLELD